MISLSSGDPVAVGVSAHGHVVYVTYQYADGVQMDVAAAYCMNAQVASAIADALAQREGIPALAERVTVRRDLLRCAVRALYACGESTLAESLSQRESET